MGRYSKIKGKVMLAKIQGVFRLTRDLELKYIGDGTPIAKLGLACSEKYKDKETQLFLDASVFGKVAELLNQYASTKGTQIFLSGKLKTEQWEKDGQRQSKVTMMIEDFQFLGSKQDSNQQGQQQGNYQHPQQQNYNAPQQQAPQQQQYQAQSNTDYQQRQPQQQRMPDQLPSIDVNEEEIPF